ncbi:MAG: sugar phosphate isomerase/epimerase [Hyphomicrobiales bacterium]|nr:sugar phosphate isomerase/epimerase [Hyphomicrobiales bacterium]
MAFPLGAHTFGFIWASEPEAAFAAAAAQGCTAVQLMATPPHFDPWTQDAARARRLRASLERNRLDLIALDLSSSDVNLASPSVDVVAFAVDAYRRLIERAAELGAPQICIGSGRRHALFPHTRAKLSVPFRRAFADIHEFAARCGVRLALENHPQGLLDSAGAINEFLEDEGYADVTVIYDVANASAIGEDPASGLSKLGARVKIIHLSDAPRGVWRHDPIGSGDIDFSAVRAALHASAFVGPVVLEIIANDPAQGLADGVRRLKADGWRFSKQFHQPTGLEQTTRGEPT